MTALAGAAAGILGLKGWAGFAFYPVVWFALAALFLLKTGWRPTAYFKSPYTVLTEGMLGGLQVRRDPERKAHALQRDLTQGADLVPLWWRRRSPTSSSGRTFLSAALGWKAVGGPNTALPCLVYADFLFAQAADSACVHLLGRRQELYSV